MKFVHTEPSLHKTGTAFLCANFGHLRANIVRFAGENKVLLCNMN